VTNTQGRVVNVLVIQSTLNDKTTDRCLRNALRGVRISGLEDVTIASVVLSLAP
jgi:hypothetical protein